jgi:hypothetical protein
MSEFVQAPGWPPALEEEKSGMNNDERGHMERSTDSPQPGDHGPAFGLDAEGRPYDPCLDPTCDRDWSAHTEDERTYCRASARYDGLTDPATEAELREEAAAGFPMHDVLARRDRALEEVRRVLFQASGRPVEQVADQELER